VHKVGNNNNNTKISIKFNQHQLIVEELTQIKSNGDKQTKRKSFN